MVRWPLQTRIGGCFHELFMLQPWEPWPCPPEFASLILAAALVFKIMEVRGDHWQLPEV